MPNDETFDFGFGEDLKGPEGLGLFEGFVPGGFDEDGMPSGDADVLFPDAEPRNQYEPLDPAKMPKIDAVKQDTEEYAARPADERTRELFAYMRPHRLSLLGILRAAAEPASLSQIGETVKSQGQRKFSVYTNANLCTMLETAGALERVTADGAPYADFEPQPDIVVVDGEEYYQPTEPPEMCWVATEAGQAMVDENKPLERMAVMFERDSGLLPIYKQVLNLARDGASMALFSEKIDSNPAIAEPRRFFVQHFVEALERCEAVAWVDSQWTITDTGEQILAEMLADVEEAEVFEPADKAQTTDGNVVPTETSGVNW